MGKEFGGYTIDFSACEETIEEVMGEEPLTPSEMTKKLWAFIRKNNLAKKGDAAA